MIKRFLLTLPVLILSISLCGCGEEQIAEMSGQNYHGQGNTSYTDNVNNKSDEIGNEADGDSVTEDSEGSTVEKTDSVFEPEQMNVSVEDSDAVDSNYAWIHEYMSIAYNWHKEHENESQVGCGIFYLNDDSIPELVCTCDDSGNTGVDLYTVIDGHAVHIKSYGTDEGNDTCGYTFRGRQAQSDSYLEKKGIYIFGGWSVGEYEAIYALRDNSLEEVFYYYCEQWQEQPEDNTEYIKYKREDGSEYEYKEKIDTENKAYENAISEVEDIYGFHCQDAKVLLSWDYFELKEDLKNIRSDYEQRFDSDKEPWQLSYRSLLYDFLFGGYAYNYIANEDVGFLLTDLYKDGNLELLIGNNDNGWVVYDQNCLSLNNFIDYIYGYIPGTDEILACGDIYDQSQVACIETLDGKKAFLCDEDWEDVVWDETLQKSVGTHPHNYTVTEYSTRPIKNDDGKSRDISEEEAQQIISKVELYHSKGVGINGAVAVNSENIERVLGFLGTPDVKDTASEDKEAKTLETEDDADSKETVLYNVEVNAQDGYVNLRKGPGTDYEIITPIYYGEQLSVYEETEDGRWLRIKHGKDEGWIAHSQVTDL